MKKVLMFLIIIISIFSAGNSKAVKLLIDYDIIETDQEPFIENGRTMVPLRVIGETLRAEVDYDSLTKTVSVSSYITDIILQIGSKEALVDGKKVKLDVPAFIVNGRTFVPLRFIAESLKCKVYYDAKEKSVLIITLEGCENNAVINRVLKDMEKPLSKLGYSKKNWDYSMECLDEGPSLDREIFPKDGDYFYFSLYSTENYKMYPYVMDIGQYYDMKTESVYIDLGYCVLTADSEKIVELKNGIEPFEVIFEIMKLRNEGEEKSVKPLVKYVGVKKIDDENVMCFDILKDGKDSGKNYLHQFRYYTKSDLYHEVLMQSVDSVELRRVLPEKEFFSYSD